MTALAIAAPPPPIIESALKEAGIDKDAALDLLRCSAAPEAVQIMACWDRLVESERKAITLDYLCAAAKVEGKSVEASRCLGIITEQAFARSINVTNLIAASKAPDVMRSAVFYAGLLDGHADRKMLLQTVGVAPVPKNQSNYFNISGNKIEKSVTINNGPPTLESVVGEVDLDKVIDAEVS